MADANWSVSQSWMLMQYAREDWLRYVNLQGQAWLTELRRMVSEFQDVAQASGIAIELRRRTRHWPRKAQRRAMRVVGGE